MMRGEGHHQRPRTLAALAASLFAVLAGCGGAANTSVARDACFTLKLATATGTSPSGAVVSARPITVPPTVVDATSSTMVGDVGDDGRVCGQASWNTVATPSLLITVGHEERAYSFGPFAISAGGGACGLAACQDLGVLVLAPERQLDATVCPLAGTVRDAAGQPLAAAVVDATDATVPNDARVVLCASDLALCQASALADASGAFTVRALVSAAPTVAARWTDASDPVFVRNRFGQATLTGCPLQLFAVTAADGFDRVKVATVTLDGDQIAWTAGFTAGTLQVWGSSEFPKWSIEAATPVAGPVTYGRVPSGAVQRAPPAGIPAVPLAPGDRIVVLLAGAAPDGYPYTGHGEYVVPPR
jgi:hypothetical protein